MTQGLTSAQAAALLKKYGLNQLPAKNGISTVKILLNQIQNPLSYILIVAITLSYLIGDTLDTLLIFGIWSLNIALGFWQEYKASKEMEALRKFEVLATRVIRDGKQIEVAATGIVPSDLVVLEPGDRVPADGQIIELYSLQVNESILTGESLPVAKSTKKDENLLFFGTTVASGRATFQVTQTGIATKFGQIAQTLTQVESEQTPLEKDLFNLSKKVGIGAIGIAAIVFIIRVLQGFDIFQMLFVSIALMVAVVPEGLPAVVTIVLALGVRKMYRKKALVRKMIAVESLGATTVVCSDKTGTLTKNEMEVSEVKIVEGNEDELLKCAVVCNSASLVLKEDGEGSFDILGDTTEGALLLWAKDRGVDIDLQRSEGKLISETPFSLQTRKMSVIWEQNGKKESYVKGAPEVIIIESKLSEAERKYWDVEYQKLAKKGLRVLAFSKNNTFLGLLGIADEIREEAKEAIRLTKQAGIKVVMVTGDNELTAKTVGENIGLLSEGDEILTGAQLNQLSEEEFLQRINKVKIFARITPEDKYKIVMAYQKLGEVVAVTGDGVNDALALKKADVGVSMGKTGTDVSREASDIVLLDDNIASLVTAVEQGRLIYNNILKVVKFLLTGNLSEILLIGFAVILGLPTPLLPTQILWINFVTDGLPALSLGVDSASPNIMRVPPRTNSNLLDGKMVRYILIGGILISVVCFIFFYYVNMYWGLKESRAYTFTLMVVLQMILPFIIRRHHSIVSNKWLLASVLFVLAMQLMILTNPFLKELFKI